MYHKPQNRMSELSNQVVGATPFFQGTRGDTSLSRNKRRQELPRRPRVFIVVRLRATCSGVHFLGCVWKWSVGPASKLEDAYVGVFLNRNSEFIIWHEGAARNTPQMLVIFVSIVHGALRLDHICTFKLIVPSLKKSALECCFFFLMIQVSTICCFSFRCTCLPHTLTVFVTAIGLFVIVPWIIFSYTAAAGDDTWNCGKYFSSFLAGW